MLVCFFFFSSRRRHTRLQGDWSSDVCSSDLLERHREALEARRYVVEAGRQWYELWVPQDPAAWEAPKLVFRDISEHPDRKSTRLNSSHLVISYAVFCLKKKKQQVYCTSVTSY